MAQAHIRRLNPISLYLDAEIRAKVDRAAEAQGLNRVEYIRRVLALHVDQDASVAPLPWRLDEAERRLQAIESSLGLAYTPDPAAPHPLTGYKARPRARRRRPVEGTPESGTAARMDR